MKEKDHLLVVEEVVVVGVVEGLDPIMGMGMLLLSMRMEVGIGIVAMPEAGVEEEVFTSVVVEEEGTMALVLIISLMQKVTTRKLLLLKAVVADVGGDIVEGVVVLDPMGRSMQLLGVLNWSLYGHNAGFLLYLVFGCVTPYLSVFSFFYFLN